MAEGGFNQGFIGQDFRWWIGQVADDSWWRENITPGKFKSPSTIRGWGYRYKVRIFGLHDLGEEVIKSENLPWANVMYPVTAGAYLTNAGQTPMIRQGNIVFGFFLDGKGESQPVIMGCLGNNSQTKLRTLIGNDDVTNTNSGKTVCVSGYSESPNGEDYKGSSKPVCPDPDKKVEKPTSEQIEEESAKPAAGVKLNQYGLPVNRDINDAQRADINSAREYAEKKGLNREETIAHIKKSVQAGISNRAKEAKSSRSEVQPGATIESEAVMIQTAADLKRDIVYCEKRVVLKPDNLVESVNKAMQTDMDNLVQNIDKSMNALQSYTDAVSMSEGMRDLKKMINDSSKRQSKYMKPVMDKMMEYSQKAINKEMTKAVSALPAFKRMEFLDVKDGIGQNLLSTYNGITGGNAGLIEGVISKTLKLDDMLDNFSSAGVNDTSTPGEVPKLKARPKVPMCTSEDMIGTILSVNKSVIDNTNDNLINGIDGFLRDAFGSVSDIGGGMTSMFSKLGNIKGSLTSALNFENIKMNVFPFEQPPNPAVSDFYTLCDGGGSQTQSALPSPMAMEEASLKHIQGIAERGQEYIDEKAPRIPQVPFGEPNKSTPDVDLTKKGVDYLSTSLTQEQREDVMNDPNINIG